MDETLPITSSDDSAIKRASRSTDIHVGVTADMVQDNARVTGIAVGASASDVRVAAAQGYVFDVEPSAGGEGIGPGVLIALSSGEVARVDEGDDTLRLLGRGHPRATALGDGIEPGEALFADGIAVYRVRRSGAVERLASTPPDAPWEDLAVTQDKKAIVLASASSVAVADVETGAVLGSEPLRGLTKITAWDDQGTMALYSPDLDGVGYGVLIPFGPKVIEAVGALASNLRVDEKGALSQKR